MFGSGNPNFRSYRTNLTTYRKKVRTIIKTNPWDSTAADCFLSSSEVFAANAAAGLSDSSLFLYLYSVFASDLHCSHFIRPPPSSSDSFLIFLELFLFSFIRLTSVRPHVFKCPVKNAVNNSNFNLLTMEAQLESSVKSEPRVKATMRLGSEVYFLNSEDGKLSEQLMSVKAKSMSILSDYITKHNVPNNVPDEPLDGSSGDECEEIIHPPKKSKKKS